jgi:hypothetical protein
VRARPDVRHCAHGVESLPFLVALRARRRIVAISCDTDEDGAPAEERRAEAVRRVELRLGKIGRSGENTEGQ